MKKQTKSNRQKQILFTLIAALFFMLAVNSPVTAQKVKFNVGDKVECDQTRMGRWEKGTVLPYLDIYDDPAKANYYRFSSDRYPSKYGEVCPMSHMRLLRDETAAPKETSADENSEQPDKTNAKENQPSAENNDVQGRQFKVGDKIEVESSKTWYKAEIIEVLDGKYKIHYDNYSDTWNEWITPARMRPIQNTKTSPQNKQKEEKLVDEETRNNQTDWRANEKWRANYKVGDKVQFTISHKAADFQTCTVTENKPESVMRVKCDAFKHWSADVYIVHSESNFTGEEITEAKPQNKPAKQTGGNSTSLKLGEYACTGSGGRMMIGLGFKVISANRYTDLDGKRSGTFTISGGTVTFRGGHLEGVTGRDLKNNWFTVASKASCGPY